MVVPINNIANENKPKQNVTVNYSTNLTTNKIQNPLVNPNFTNVQNGKALNPTQQITVIGKGTDPEVIANHPTKINPYAKEQPTETQTLVKPQTTTQTNYFSNTVLQITNGLTLPELFNILNQYGININNWENAKLTIKGNKIILNNGKNTLEIENKDGWTIIEDKEAIKEKEIQYPVNYLINGSPPYTEVTTYKVTYYAIDPKSKVVVYTGNNLTPKIIQELPLIEIFGKSIVEADNSLYANEVFNGESLNQVASQVLKITGGLTLPELFQILGQNESFWTPTYSYSSWSGGTSGFDRYVANVTINGNKIVFTTNNQISNSWSGGSTNDTTINTLTIKPYTATQNGKTYHLVLAKQQQYTYNNFEGNVVQDTLTWYYIIDPKTKQVIYKAQEPPQQSQYWLPEPQSGYIAQPSQVINNVLQQYGYALPSNILQEINNLQPGQSITVFARVYNSQLQEWGSGSAEFEITYLGNNQYQIKSVNRFYDFYNFYNPWTSINETITVPTYSINQQGQISTTNLSVSGQVTTYGTTNISEPYYTATYNVNETIPINYGYNTQTGQLTFWGGNQQGGATLQSISLPTITTQQLQALENGQNIGLKRGWYYNPQTGQIIQVSYQTVQQPQVSNQYSYIFYNPNVPYSTTNPNVTQYIAVNTNTDTIYFLNPYGKVLNSISFANTQALNNYLYQNYEITLTNNGPVITTSTNTQNIASTITTIQSSTSTSSLSIPTIISDIWNGLTTIGNDIYSWFTSLSKPQNNTLQLNYQQLAQEVLYSQASTGTTTSYSTNTPTNQPQILQYSFFSPQILSDIWNGITTLGNDVYNWFTSLFSSKGSISLSNITNYNYPSINLSNIYQDIQNWEASNYNQYVQTLTKPTTSTSQIQIVPSNSITGESGSLYYQQLTQQINSNPYYPYTTSTSPYFNLTTIPAITDTTATYTQMNAMNTINQIKNVQSGITTYNLLSDISSLLGAKNTAKYYQTLSQQAQIYGSPSFYQAEQLGQTERLIATITAASMPLTIAGIGLSLIDIGAEIGAEEATTIGAEEVSFSILPRVTLSTALTRIGTNAAINAAENVAAGEITSYALTGKPLSTQQALELAAEGAITGGIAGGFSLFAESPNSLLASFGTQFTPLNFAKNLGLNIGGSLISSNVYSYITSGQLPSLQQDIYSIEEAGPATLAYSSIAGILESPNIANRFLKLITSPNSNKYWPIAARVLYDTGANSLAMFGSSLTAQGVGNLIGAQQGINLEEAATSALFAGILTFGFEGFSAFRNPGAFVKSLGYYPVREATINADTLRVIRRGNYDIEITGKGKVPEARPIIGNRVYTEEDFANVKPIQYEFDIGGRLKVQKANGYVEIPINKYEKLRISLNEPGQTYYGYKGIITTSTDKGSLLSNIEGVFKAQRNPYIENTEDYMNSINAEQEELEKIYPQFKELRNVPKKGYILSRNLLDNRLIPFVQNVNAGQDVLTASINTAEDIAGSRFVSLVTSSDYLVNQGYMSPDEIDQLLGTTSRQYNDLISELENIKQEAYNEISNNALSPETIRAANLKGIDNVIMPEDLKMKMNNLPNPNFINRVNRVVYYINAENGEALPNIQYVTIPSVENSYGIESFGFSSPLYRETNINSNIQPITNRDLLILTRLNNANFVRSVSSILDLMRNGAISPNEAQTLLESEVRQYYDTLNYIKSLNQKVPSNIKLEDSVWQYLYGAKPRNLDLYSNNLNLYNPFNKVYIVGDVSKVKTNLGETYRTMGEGIIANSDNFGMGTIYQVMRNNEGKTWFSVQQSTTIPTSKNEYLTFSYQESVDPITQMLQAFGKEIQGQPLNPEEIQIIGKYLGQSKVIAPPVSIIRPYTNYGFSIIGTNQNAINVNNNYNIGMSRVPNTNRNQLETNIIQNQYIEHPQLNEYNIQNELNVYRNKALESLRQDYLSSISTMHPLQNQFSRDNLYGLKNIVGLQNIQSQSIRGREKQIERLRARQKEMERQKFVNIEKVIVPQILIEEGLAVGLLLDRGVTTKERPRIPLPPPIKHEPTTPPPPPPPKTPREYPPFGFPEITIMGQPIRGLAPGFGRGVRSMYDIQYALSRLTL